MSRISKKYLDNLYRNTTLFESTQIRDDVSTSSEFDIFLSYPYVNKDYALKIYKLFKNYGYKVYIDIKDDVLDRDKVDRKTAERIAEVMNKCKCLVYIHAKSTAYSKWCPWELGYMSSKTKFRCATILLTEDDEDFPREEFLQMYPYIDICKDEHGIMHLWANELDSNKYITLRGFIDGGQPHAHK